MNAIVEIHQDIMATLYSHIVGQLAVKMNSKSGATWGNKWRRSALHWQALAEGVDW